MPPPPRQPPPTQPPPQTPPPDETVAALIGLTGGAAAGAVPPAGTVAAAGVSAVTLAEVVASILAAFDKFFTFRLATLETTLYRTLATAHPEHGRNTIQDLVDEEVGREREFQRRSRARLARELPELGRDPDPGSRRAKLQRILDRERRLTEMRERAVAERLDARAAMVTLKQESPLGAFWLLSPNVKQHTADCLAMANRFWPWPVLNEIHPPLHPGCPCRLIGLEEAISLGLMRRDQVPRDDAAAVRLARRLYSEAKALEEGALEEARRGYRGWDERFAKGTVKGGQFRPRRGGTAAAIRKLLRVETPAQRSERGRGRYEWIRGRYLHIPEADAWEHTAGGARFHSPAGSTDVYRDGVLVADETGLRGHVDVMRPSKSERGLVRADPGSDLLQDVDAEVDRLMADHSVRARRAITDMRPDNPPVREGERPPRYALDDAGFRMKSRALVDGEYQETWHHPSTGSELLFGYPHEGEGEIGFVEWEPGAPPAHPTLLDSPPRNADEMFVDTQAMAARLGERYDAEVYVTAVHRARADQGFSADHQGAHGWDGAIRLGQDVEPEPSAPEFRHMFVYASYKVASHEAGHGVNPVSREYYRQDHNKAMEEALTEETAHFTAVEWLRHQGRIEVLEALKGHPTHDRAIGTYRQHREGLRRVLIRAGVPQELWEEVIFDLKFKTLPEDRIPKIAAMSNGQLGEEQIKSLLVAVGTDPFDEFDYEAFEPLIRPDLSDISDHRALYELDNGDLVRVGDTVSLSRGGRGKITTIEQTHSGTVFGVEPDEEGQGWMPMVAREIKGRAWADDKGDEGGPLVLPEHAELVRRLRSQPGQGLRRTRTTRPQTDENGVVLPGQWDAIAIQAADLGMAGNVERYNEWTRKRLRELTADAEVAVRIYPERLDHLVETGSLRSGSRERLGGDRDRKDSYYESRREWEGRVFGDHPVYGYLAEPQEDLRRSATRAFGDIKVVLKPEARERTTFIYSDSNFVGVGEGGALPSPVNDPQPEAVPYFANLRGVEQLVVHEGDEPLPLPPLEHLSPEARRNIERTRDEEWARSLHERAADEAGWKRWRHGDFFEAQIHGDITLDDVERVEFPAAPSERVARRLDEAGVRFTVRGDDDAKGDEGPRRKYPRTPHLPWSNGGTDDDVRLAATSQFQGQRVVVTEKMDGENITLRRDGFHARSVDSGGAPWRSRLAALHARVGHEIPEGWRVVGESLEAKHSIGYERVPLFMVFGVFDENDRALPWSEVEEWAALLDLPTVPTLYEGDYDEQRFRDWDPDGWKSRFGPTLEGYVLRTEEGFDQNDFPRHVAKWVRPDHVQTDQHWTTTWEPNDVEPGGGDAKGDIGHPVIVGDLMSDPQEMAALYEGFDHNGVTVRTTGIDRFSADEVQWTGDLFDAQGVYAGFAERYLQRTPDGRLVAYNAEFYLRDDLQGQGIATAFLARTERQLVEAGVEAATLRATDVGGYAWAARGYEFDIEGYTGGEVAGRANAASLLFDTNAEGMARVEQDWPELAEEFRSRFPTQDDISRYRDGDTTALEGKFSSPAEIASWGREHARKTDGPQRSSRPRLRAAHSPQTWPGKAFLIGSRWDGIKYLQRRAEGRIEEGLVASMRRFEPDLHPRDRLGRFREVLHQVPQSPSYTEQSVGRVGGVEFTRQGGRVVVRYGDDEAVVYGRAGDAPDDSVVAERAEALVHAVNHRPVPEEAKALADVFADFEHDGLTVKVQTATKGEGGGLEVTASILDGDREVGHMVRNVARTKLLSRPDAEGLVAYHNELRLDGDAQRRGFATALNRRTEERYREMGVEEIRLDAADDGAYVWAKAGFVQTGTPGVPAPTSSNWESIRAEGVTDEELEAIQETFTDGGFDPVRVAQVGIDRPFTRPDGEMTHAGREFLRRTSWTGYKALKPSGGYQPDPTAPDEGDWVWADSPLGRVAVGWRQSHDRLVRDAIHSWKGWPTDMRIHADSEREGAPQPGSGSGKQKRAQAAALMWEIAHNGQTTPVKLYRGSHQEPRNTPQAWTESRAVAKKWAKKDEAGQVWELEAGEGRGLRVGDYITGGLDLAEREWIVWAAGIEEGWREWLHPRDRLGKWIESLHRRATDREGRLEYLARTVTDAIGIDPYDVDVGKLEAHCAQHERTPVSRFRFGSPCAREREVDFAVHRWLPGVLEERYPSVAKRLLDTSPRWGRLGNRVPLPLTEAEVLLLEEAREFRPDLHLRDRLGRWRDMPDLPKLDLKPGPGGKGLTKSQVEARARLIVKDFLKFYGGEDVDVSYEPDYLADVESDARFRHKGQPMSGLFYGKRIMEKLKDPEMGVEMARIIAHEAAHSISGVQPGPLPGFSQTVEEGAAEVLSIFYWARRGQPFDERDATRIEGRWETGLEHSVAYREEVAEVIKRAASRVGWDREAIVDEVEGVMRGDHNARLAWRDATDPDVESPHGDDAVALMRWLISGKMEEAGFKPELHPRDRLGRWVEVLRNYVGPGGYKRVNGKLRGTLDSDVDPDGNLQAKLTPEESKELDSHVADIDAAFSAAEPLDRPVTVWRGMRTGLGDLKPGDKIEDPAYASTSRNREFAEGYADEDGTLLRIEVPAGEKALDIDDIAGSEDWRSREQEVLLPRGVKMKVTKVEKRGEGRLVHVKTERRRDRPAKGKLYGATPERLKEFANALRTMDTWTRADVEAGRVPGVTVAGLDSGVAGSAGLATGTISIAPSGFDKDGKVNPHLFAHEVGHYLTGAIIKDGKVPPELEAFAEGRGRAEGRYGKMTGEGNRLFGDDRKLPEEFLADMYADLIYSQGEFRYIPGFDGPDDPGEREKARKEFESSKKTRLLRLIGKVAQEHGLPGRGIWRTQRQQDGSYALVRRELVEGVYDERLHPRGRGGRWVRVPRTGAEIGALVADAFALRFDTDENELARVKATHSQTEQFDDPEVLAHLDEAAEKNAAIDGMNELTEKWGAPPVLLRESLGEGFFAAVGRNGTISIEIGANSLRKNFMEKEHGERKPGVFTTAHDTAGVLRHEWFHTVESALSNEQVATYRSLFPRHEEDATGEDASGVVPRKGSIDRDRILRELSINAAYHQAETSAEIFALVTDPDYNPDDWPEWVNAAGMAILDVLFDTPREPVR